MSNVPAFKRYFGSTANMNSQQRQFYESWLTAWQRGKPIDVEGQVSYLFCYLYSVLEKGAERALPELIRIKDAYPHEGRLLEYCCLWISDCFVVLGQYRDAIDIYPILSPDERSSLLTDYLLSLKVLVGDRVSGKDVLTLCGPKVTAFGKKHLNDVAQYTEAILRTQELKTGVNMLSDWVKDTYQHPYQVFRGSSSLSSIDIASYDFSKSERVVDFVSKLTREAENTVREEAGLPKVGEGWISETELYYEIKTALPDFRVQHHARPDWLVNQHLDIYIPELSTAIEYQGTQHDEAIEFFGGQQAFNHRQRLDTRKRRRCKCNGIHLIYVHPGYVLRDVLEQLGKGV